VVYNCAPAKGSLINEESEMADTKLPPQSGCINCKNFELYSETLTIKDEPIGRCLAEGPLKYLEMYNGEFWCSLYDGKVKSCVSCIHFDRETFSSEGNQAAECLSKEGPQQAIWIDDPRSFYCIFHSLSGSAK
jgi:hypothetical protein